MRIKSIMIHRYGPLAAVDISGLSDFNLVFGKNERGKTLIIDAVLKMLFKKEKRLAANFSHLDRVAERPEGFIVLDDKKNGEFKLGSGESVSKHFDRPIAPEDFRNIFVTRDSDLSIKSQAEYYTDITDRLTGLRTKELARIMKSLQQMGRLTGTGPESRLANNQETDHIADKIKRAEELIRDIDELKQKLKESNYDSLEKALAESENGLVRMREKFDIMTESKTNEKLRTDHERLGRLKAVIGELTELKIIDSDKLSTWRSLDEKVSKSGGELQEIQKDIEKNEKLLEVVGNALRGADSKLQVLEEKRKKIDRVIRPALEECVGKRADCKSGRKMDSFLVKLATALIALTALSTVAGTIGEASAFFALTVVFAVGSAAAIGLLLKSRIKRMRCDSAADKLFSLTAGIHSGERTLRALALSLDGIEEGYVEARSLKESLAGETGEINGAMNGLLKRKKQVEEDIREYDARLRELRETTRADSSDKLQKLWDIKNGLLQEQSRLIGSLSGFPETALDDVDIICGKMKEIDDRLKKSEGSIKYRESEYSELRDGIDNIERKIEDLDGKLEEGRRSLDGLEKETNKSGIFKDESVTIRTSEELEALKKRLIEYIGKIEIDKVSARETLKIFRAIEMNERSQVGDLFGKDAEVSKYFRDITEGYYKEVTFDIADNRISILSSRGESVDAEALSGGTIDQLYLAIRLSLGKKYLKKGGFFILDDPFIKSDSDRLGKQIDILKNIRKLGWQIIYFSAKNEVREALDGDISNGRVRLISLTDHV